MPYNMTPPVDLSTIVHGPCIVYFGVGNLATPGGISQSPLYFLGLSQDGGKKSTRQLTVEIPSDIAGPMSPQDFQRAGKITDLNIVLSQVSLVNLEIMMNAINAGAGAGSGAGYLRGLPIAANGCCLRIIFTSQLETKRYRTCIVNPAIAEPQGTRWSPYEFQWLAWEMPYIDGTGAPQFVPLWDNIQG